MSDRALSDDWDLMDECAALYPSPTEAAEVLARLRVECNRAVFERDRAKRDRDAAESRYQHAAEVIRGFVEGHDKAEERTNRALARIMELESVVKKCDTCQGDGVMDVVVGWNPGLGEETYDVTQCAECRGTCIGSWGQALERVDDLEARLRRIRSTMESDLPLGARAAAALRLVDAAIRAVSGER